MKKHFTIFNHKQLIMRSLSLLATCLLTVGLGFSQMSGSYTINSGSATGGTNFASFNDLRVGLLAGINGPVKVSVVSGSGPYNERVSFRAVSGANSTNTITIDGNGETITNGTNYFVIEMNGADYFTFDNLNVEQTRAGSSYQKCFWFRNGSDYNTIQNCTITMPNTASRDYSSAYIGFMQNIRYYYYYGYVGTGNVIHNNKMYSGTRKGPHNGVIYVGRGSRNTTMDRVTITNNDIKDFYRYGAYLYYSAEVIFNNNEVHNTGSVGHTSGNTQKMGVYLYGYYNTVGKSQYNNNYIHDLDATTYTVSHYGLYLFAYYTRGTGIEASNNRIEIDKGSGGGYGIYMYPYRNTLNGDLIMRDNYIKIIANSTATSTYTYAYGIYCSNYYALSLDNFKIERNEMHLYASYYSYGIYAYCYYNRGLVANATIHNNIINAASDGYTYGIYVYANIANRDFEILNNTISMSGWKGNFSRSYTAYGIYSYYSRGPVENNIIDFNKSWGDRAGTAYGIYHYYGSARYSKNSLYMDPTMGATKHYGSWNRSDRTTFANWTSSAGSAATTVNEQANFIDATREVLVPSNPNLWDAGFVNASISDDVWKTSRSNSTPDLGAVEFYYDVEIDTVKIAGNNECAGYKETIKAQVVNNSNFDFPGGVEVDLYENGNLVQTVRSAGFKAGEKVDVPFSLQFFGAGSLEYEARLKAKDQDNGNQTAKNSIDIFSAPSGGEFTANAGSKGMHRTGAAFDVTIIPDGIAYDVNSPTLFTNADYNTGAGWEASVTTTYEDGSPVASGDAAVWNAPSGSTDGYITLNPTNTVIDSMLTLTLRVYDEISDCDTFIVRKVLIAPEGKPSFLFPLVNCSDEAVAFDNTSTVSSGSLSYKWTFGDGNGSILTHPIHKYAAAGTYTVVLTTTTHPWEYVNEVKRTITVKPVPEAKFTRVNACEGTPITLTNTSVGATEYVWNFGDPNKPESNMKDETASYAPGGYLVTLTAKAGGCEDTYARPVYQFAVPVAKFTNNTGKCNTDVYEFINNSTISDGSVGFSWDFDDNGNISTDANPKYPFVNAGSHDVSLTAVSEFGCESKTNKTISVLQGPKVDFTYGSTCSETATPFTDATVSPSGFTATNTWDFGDGSAMSNDVNPTHNWMRSGDVMVKLSVKLNNDCVGEMTKSIKVLPQPVANFKAMDDCAGEMVVFENNSTWSEGDIEFTWDFDGAIVADATTASPKGVAANSGTYDVMLTAKVSEGCSNSVTKQLTISDAPNTCQIVSSGDHSKGNNAYKFESSADGVNAGTENDVTYYWTVENHGVYTGDNVTVDFQEEGDFSVKLTARNNVTGCECTTEMNHNNVGIEDELGLNEGVILYPNPAKSHITIEVKGDSKEIKVEILNSVGAKVLSADDLRVAGGKVTLDVNDLPSGLYLVRITSGNTLSSTKKLNITK